MQTQKRLPSSRGRRLDGLGFIKNHVLPFHTLEIFLILYSLIVSSALLTCFSYSTKIHKLVRSNQDMERRLFAKRLVLPTPNLSQRLTILR